MSRQEKMTAKMCHPSAKSTVAKATADSPASTDVTSPSLTEPASLDTASSPSHKSSSPIPSTERQGKKALTRFDKIMEDMKKKSPEEITAFIQKYGPKKMESLVYEEAWVNSCFTSFIMLDFILKQLHIELDMFVTGERSISK
ncbi:uncharacterized protein MCYG_07443 [Microsporum canis CBS 113480]|uniref:Uncharacterized protein n=1 Tax=Arthroderma otae (strain ATCC MYA-4605 / CBS 113480) TaxID=554155 RepID=C5FYM6_ARTOC|nr:uncharacterized protein MCYG_07443 [Microsporum canis CBS 113480]EEQ34624.1 predicted protein [Microsporum canis CBS 113480]